MGRMSNLDVQFTAYPQLPRTAIWPSSCVVARIQSFAETESLKQSIDAVSFETPNWDGYDALAVSGETKRNAMAAINALAATVPPTVASNPNGTLSFEWETEHGIGQLEIGKTRYSFYVKPSEGRAILVDGEASKISSFLGAFVDEVLYPKPSEPAFQKLKFSAANV